MKDNMDGKPVVFIIDDDPSLRAALMGLFGSVGLQAEVFASAPEFLHAKLPEVPSCLVLDVRLPGLSGLDFQAQLANADIHIPIVFITGHGDIPMTVRAMRAGAVEFLTKPFRDQDLLNAVQLGLDRDRARRESEKTVAPVRARFDSLMGSTGEPSQPAGSLEIRVFGDFAVLRDGKPVALPPSRKTRALLAFLSVVNRPQQRERLCTMFWDIPDDPRGALRWSLSKIRPILNLAGPDTLVANRNTVGVRSESVALDFRRVKARTSQNLSSLDLTELEQIASLLQGGFLEDLSLPRCPAFEAWRVAHVSEVDLLKARTLRLLIDRLRTDPVRALPYAHDLQAMNSDDGALAAEVKAVAERARQHAVKLPGAALGQAGSDFPQPEPPRQTVPTADRSSPIDLRFCTTTDGVRIAYTAIGSGPPIVKAANWLSHLQYDWESPIWRHWIEGLAAQNRLIRYDERGNGLSDWDVEDLSFEAMLADLESIVDAARLDRFALLGISQGCAISIAYAVKHPERVSHLVLYGGYVQGWRARGDPEEIARRSAMGTLMRQGWGQDIATFRQLFTSLFVPGATHEQMDWFNELQRKSVSPDNAARLYDAFANIDASVLMPRVTAPTLVLHARGDASVPYGCGRVIAEGIPGARFVTLESSNHILLAHEPAFARFLDEVRRFTATDFSAAAKPADGGAETCCGQRGPFRQRQSEIRRMHVDMSV
jgi:FixJ family two-component response regulator/pimeloyl-ACP methyl ester carboxylesterase